HFHEAILDQIAIGQAPAKTTYDIGDSLDTTGLVVTLIYNDGSTSDLLSGFQVSELDASSVGTKTITVSYMNKTTTFDVSVIATPSDIAINTFPTKQNYWVGDTLDTAGLSLTVTYTDGSTDVVTSGFDVSGYTAATPGTKKITVTYQGLTTTFDVVVNEITATGISIATPPQKTTYWVGDTLDTTGLTVKVDYSNGSSDYIETGFILSSSDLNAAGTQPVTVTYQGFTDTFHVVVNEVTVTGFSIATTPDKLDYWIGEKLDTTGLTLNVNYSNGSSDSVDTGFEVSGFESETEGTKTVTVTYHGFTDTFDVNIITGGVCGENLIWTIVDGVLTIAGSGAMYDYTYGSAPWYGKELTALVVDPSVTYIGKYAFAKVACLTQYHIANGVLVGEGAFAKCKNLTAITVDADHSAYTADQSGALYNKDMTTLIMVPAGYSGTFVVPLTVTAISESAFFGCAKLTAVKFQGKAGATGGFTERDSTGNSVSANTTSFGSNNVTTIGSHAFNGCVKLAKIDIPTNVTAINNGTFKGCTSLKTIIIPNGVSTIDNDAFSNCTALNVIIFEGTKAQWTDNTIGENNESLTDSPILYRKEIKLSNAAPTLYDNIAMNYKVNKHLFDEMGVTDLYLKITFNGVETVLDTYTVSEDDSQYIFTFYNIAPNQMDDTLSATLYCTYAGTEYTGATLDYSVATYCYRMLNNSAVVNNDAYAELRTLLVDLLHYGAAAQEFTGFTGEKVDARLTATQLAWGTAADPTLENKTVTNYATVADPTATWASVGLVLEDAVTMRFKFTTADITGLTVKITSDTNTEGWVIHSDDFLYEESTGRYYIDFGGLHAGQMRECVYVTVYNGETAVSNTLRYAIESYAYKYASNESYPTLAALVKAMMRYGDAAYNFAN
ncbi:MAG: bacterial Ig-like domain-containing protein, partial [Oscillospiraceae bacterium]|nr:bacterial Ig-like domain-containing protein [Oscillospiraceae bacterium]